MPYTYNPIVGNLDYYNKSIIASGDYATDTELTTVSGDLQTNIDNKTDEIINAVPSSDHSANGPQCNTINAGESITVIDCVRLGSDSEWHKTDADAVATANGFIAISLESKEDGEAMNVALPGSFVRDGTWDWTVDDEDKEIYLDTVTSGGLTQTAPSGTDDVVRSIGYATHSNRMFFDPDKTVTVHA